MDCGAFLLLIVSAFAFLASLLVLFPSKEAIPLPLRTRLILPAMLSVPMLLAGAHVYKTFFLDEALYMAASAGDVNRVRTLLDRGADPDAEWEDGTTAIRAARRNGHDAVVALLKEAGAEDYGESPVEQPGSHTPGQPEQSHVGP